MLFSSWVFPYPHFLIFLPPGKRFPSQSIWRQGIERLAKGYKIKPYGFVEIPSVPLRAELRFAAPKRNPCFADFFAIVGSETSLRKRISAWNRGRVESAPIC